MSEEMECQSNGCQTQLYINETHSVFIDANYTSFIGINLMSKANCLCDYNQRHSISDSCVDNVCLNGGVCHMSEGSAVCHCPEGADGPNCEVTTRSFNGQGWVWIKPLAQCSPSHISLEIITQISNGLILYSGPMNRPPFGLTEINSDFISLELINGKVTSLEIFYELPVHLGMARLLCDFGSGSQELIVKTPKALNDGKWHTIDIFFETQTFRLMIDNCVDAVIYDSEPLRMDRSRCENTSEYQFFSEKLNINNVLQVGGISHQSVDKYYNWTHKHSRIGFTGCVKNLIQNDYLYDFGSVLNSVNSLVGCTPGII